MSDCQEGFKVPVLTRTTDFDLPFNLINPKISNSLSKFVAYSFPLPVFVLRSLLIAFWIFRFKDNLKCCVSRIWSS